ncbi:MAG: hypothetical protein MK297_11155 [Planctomycetes bacterium]|nr:hypothetical protein [Planctomycetota bacterium]
MNGSFGALDWGGVGALLLITTWIGHRAAGRQESLRDFFLGGRRLPWYAVAASIVATEISAVTFISLPSVVAREGGDWTYLQIGLFGSLFARGLIAWLLVPAYYEREVFSPYDYMGAKLGEGVRRAATALFALGGILGQSARVYLTAVVLEVLLAEELAWVSLQTGASPLAAAVAVITLVAMAWTLMGGIATVVWTDAVLFLLFLAGIGAALWTVSGTVEGGLAAVLESGWSAGKMRLFDLRFDLSAPYTLWAAVIASTWGGVGFYGTDQLLAQRLLCCQDVRAARRAVLASYAAILVTALVAVVGVALWAHYQEHAMSAAAQGLYEEKADRLFPIFVVEVVPHGLKGLIVAGALAAAISSLDSIVAALSQTTQSLLKPASDSASALKRSRALVVFWSLVLGCAAVAIDAVAESYASILDLALAMASYTGGALLAGFLLAFLPLRTDGRGFPYAAALSVLAVFAVTSHQPWGERLGVAPEHVVLVAGVLLCGTWALTAASRTFGAALALLIGLGLTWWLATAGTLPGVGVDGGVRVLAWPWFVPLGSTIAFTWTLLLSGRRARTEIKA